MMTADFNDLVRDAQARRRDSGQIDTDLLLTDGPANDPLVFCRGQAAEGLALLTRRYGIHGYATSVHTACASGGQAIGTGMKIIRRGYVDRVLVGGFDSMISPIGIGGFCLLVGVVDGQRHAGAREPSFRRDAQRLPAGRRRGLPRARGVGARAFARRAHLCRARRRRQLAVELPHHRFAARRRRSDPVDAPGARRCRREHRGHRLHQRARHVDAHERPQRDGRDPRRVRGRGGSHRRQLDQELDGSPHCRRRRRRRRRVRARDRARRDAGEREPAGARHRLQSQLHHRRGAPRARAHDAVELVRLRRQQQLHRDAAPGSVA